MARQVVLGKIAATVNGHNTVEITASDGVTLTQDDAVLHLSAPGVAENAREISELIEDNNTNKSDIALNKEAIAANSEAIANMENNKVNIDTFNAHVNDNIKHITAQERDVWNNKADGTEFNNLKSDYQDTKDELSRHEDDTEKHTSYEEREYWNKKIDQDNLIGTDTAVPRDDWSVYSSDKVDELLQGVDTVINTKINEIEENIANIMATKQNKIKKSINSYPSVLLTVPGSDAAPDLVYQGALLLGEDISTWMWDNYIDYNDNEKQEPSYKTETGMYLMDVSTIERSFRNVYYTDMLLTSKLSLYMYNHYKNKSITTSSGKTVSKYVTTTDENDPLCLGIYHNVPLTIYNTTYNANVINSWMNEKFNILDFQRTGYGYNVPATPAERQNDSTLTSLLIHGFVRDLVIGQSLAFQSHFGMTKGDDMIAAVYNTYADMDRIVGANSQYENWKSIAAMNGSNAYILVLHDETHDNDATIYQLTANYNLTSHTVTYQRKYSLFVRSMLTDIIGITKIADKVIFYNNDDASVLSTLMPTSTSKWPEATVGSKVMTINTYDTTNDGKITGKIYEVTSINDTSGAITLGAPTNVPSLYELIKDNFINKNIIATSFGDDYGTASDGNKIPNVDAIRNFYYSHLNNDGIWDNNNIYSTSKVDSLLNGKTNLTDFNTHKNNTTMHLSSEERTVLSIMTGGIIDPSHDTYIVTGDSINVPRDTTELDANPGTGSYVIVVSDIMHSSKPTRYIVENVEGVGPSGGTLITYTDSGVEIDIFNKFQNLYSSFFDHSNNIDIHISADERTKWNNHINDTVVHITSSERTTWNAKEDSSNKKTDLTDSSNISDTYYPTTKAVKDYVNESIEKSQEIYGMIIAQDGTVSYIGKNRDYASMTPIVNRSEEMMNYGDWKNAWFLQNMKVAFMNTDGSIYEYFKYLEYKDEYLYSSDEFIEDFSKDSPNVMIGIPTIWVKIDENYTNGIKILFSPTKIDDSYKAYAHTDLNGNIVRYKWISAYPITLCYDDNDNVWVKSKPIHTTGIDFSDANKRWVLGYQNLDYYYSIIMATDAKLYRTDSNGISYYLSRYSIESYSDRMLINLLLILLGKSINVQNIFGDGYCNMSSSYDSYDTYPEFASNNARFRFYDNGQHKRYQNQTHLNHGIQIFGIENWWGNLPHMVSGMHYISTNNHTKYGIYTQLQPTLQPNYGMDYIYACHPKDSNKRYGDGMVHLSNNNNKLPSNMDTLFDTSHAIVFNSFGSSFTLNSSLDLVKQVGIYDKIFDQPDYVSYLSFTSTNSDIKSGINNIPDIFNCGINTDANPTNCCIGFGGGNIMYGIDGFGPFSMSILNADRDTTNATLYNPINSYVIHMTYFDNELV